MPLRPVHPDASLIGQPLPWNLYTASGVLVAGAGLVVADAEQLDRLKSRSLFRKALEEDEDTGPVERLRAAIRDYPAMLENTAAGALEPAIRDLARELIALSGLDHDACLGLTRRLPMRDPAARHCLIAALIVLDLGEQMDLAGAELESAAAATLTMNIAAMRLHADLAQGLVRYGPAIRAEMQRHPEAGAGQLLAGGIVDPVWLAAVRGHHENLDGSGYPLGLKADEIAPATRMVRVADFYAAKIGGRHYRAPRTLQFALKQLFGSERGRLDNHIAVLLLRRLGLYPPGTLVRLANREVAVVVRKEGNGDAAGHVMSFLDGRGRRLKEPVERDSGRVDYAVVDVVEAEPNWPDIGWEAFWGY